MKTLFRVLGAVAAVAATGAAIVVLDKVLNDKDPLHVENVEFPEEAEKDPAEAEKTAEAYAEGEARETAPGDAWPPAFEKAPAEPETAPAAPVVEKSGRGCNSLRGLFVFQTERPNFDKDEVGSCQPNRSIPLPRPALT